MATYIQLKVQTTIPSKILILTTDFKCKFDEEKLIVDKPPTKNGKILRPNMLLYQDDTWNSSRSDEQKQHLETFLKKYKSKEMVIIELGVPKKQEDLCELKINFKKNFKKHIELKIN